MNQSFLMIWRTVVVRQWLAGGGLALWWTAAALAAPNFLIVVADDMRADAIRALGVPAARTPVLDRLVNEGCAFRQAYCLGSNSGAVCVPSRAMLMSGRAFFHAPNDLAGVRTLPEHLEALGYDTFLAGKWHNGKESCQRSFARGGAVFLGGMTDQFHPTLASLEGHRLQDGHRSDIYSTDAISQAAARFLASRDRSRPFFAWVAFTVPHDPRTPKTSADSAAEIPHLTPRNAASAWKPAYDVPFSRLHDPVAHPLPANFLPHHPFDNGWLTVRDEELLAWPRDPAEIRREWAAYHGMISHLDARVGDLMDALEKSGDTASTYVVFLSDHGLALGSHGLLGKQSLYEHSMKAPLVVRGPGVPAGIQSEALVYLHDLHATVLELAGQPQTDSRLETDSRSLVPHWRPAVGNAAPVSRRDHLLLAFTDTARAVRTDRWKLIRHPRVDVTQLFDLLADPDERHNLAPQQPGQVDTLRRVLEAAQRAAGDAVTWSAPTHLLRPAAVDLTARPRDPYAGRPWDRPAR